MLVARKVATQMLTGIIEEERVNFDHDLCAGQIKKGEAGVFGSVGGTFFEVDFGQHDDRPNQAVFFVPRHAVHLRFDDDAIITVQTYETETGKPIGYPEDVDLSAVKRGKLKVRKTYSV
jgi:hypothetical protein